jgi:signal transduction histidine kinase
LEAVVRRFMEFVKRERLNLAAFDLARLLSRVASRESRSPGAGVAPVPPAEATVRGDEELLERAFENLVRNAREAAGPQGRVWIEVAQEEAEAVVRVDDDGPGLSPETLAGIRPFQTTKAGGLGLGLALTLKLVRLHGGDLKLENRRPRGARATVRLPLQGPPPQAERYES